MNMREIINLCETASKSSYRATLKDGTRVIITLTMNGERLDVEALVDGVCIGDATFYEIATNDGNPDRGSWSSANTRVDTNWRRKGVATAMYDSVTKAGYRIIPSGIGYGGKLTPDGQALWDSRVQWKKVRGSSLKVPVRTRHWKPFKRPRT